TSVARSCESRSCACVRSPSIFPTRRSRFARRPSSCVRTASRVDTTPSLNRTWRFKEGVVSTRDAVRTQLEGRLANLLRRVGKIEGDLTQAHDRDSQERATEVENDEVLEGLDEMTLEEIRQIRTALKHIESGS